MTRTVPRLELWSGLGCIAGSTRLSTGGFIWPWISGTTTYSETGDESFPVEMPITSESAQIIRENHVVRLWRSDTDYEEWIVRKVVKTRDLGGRVTATCTPPSVLLAEHGFVPEWQTTDPLGDPLLEVSAQGTLTDLFQTYLIDNPKVNAVLPSLGLGTIAPTVEIEMSWSFASAQAFINQAIELAGIAAGLPYLFRLVRNGSTSYDLTVRAA